MDDEIQLAQTRTRLIVPSTFILIFCRLGSCLRLLFPVTYRFFPLLSLLPVRFTANVTIGPLPQTKHFFDIRSTPFYSIVPFAQGVIIAEKRSEVKDFWGNSRTVQDGLGRSPPQMREIAESNVPC